MALERIDYLGYGGLGYGGYAGGWYLASQPSVIVLNPGNTVPVSTVKS